MGVVDDCDPNKWSKVEIEAICKEFGYTSMNRLWYKIGDNEGRMFHLIDDDLKPILVFFYALKI